MRKWIISSLCLLALPVTAQVSSLDVRWNVDLDQPGAFDRLEAERPDHFARVIAEMDRIQTPPEAEKALQRLKFAPSKEDPHARRLQTVNPAKTKVAITIDEVIYSVTLRYTKNPARVMRAN